MTIHESRSFKKLDKYTRGTVNLAIKKLKNRYEEYRKQNIVITNLFGDDIIIHNIIEHDFYVYKCCARGIQIRLLYEVDKDNEINVIDFYIKNSESIRTNVGEYNQRYLDMFSKIAINYKRSVKA